MVTWNAAALFHGDHEKLMERRKVLERVCKEADIVVLQEVHGCLEDFAVHIQQLAASFRIDVSRCASSLEGGVATLLRKTLFKQDGKGLEDLLAQRCQNLDRLVCA